MLKRSAVLSLLASVGLGFGLPANSPQAPLTVASAPPVVVKTMPPSGAMDVDTATGEIRIHFSKDMMTDRMWSLVKVSADSFPELSGDVRYLDSRTFIVPVRLEPGRTYAMWINREPYTNFVDEQRTPAVPYLLVFETKD